MSKLYMLAFNDDVAKDAIVGVLNSSKEILDWHSCMTNTIFIATELDKYELFNLLDSSVFVSKNRYLYIDLDNFRGRFPEETWTFLKKYNLTIVLDKERGA